MDNQNIDEFKKRLDDLQQKIDLPKLKSQLQELEFASADPALWQDETRAKSTLSQLSSTKDIIESTEDLLTDFKNLRDLIELNKESSDNSFIEEINSLQRSFSKKLVQTEVYTYLSEKYDDSEAILSIHAGQGGVEAMDWANMLSRMYTRFFERRGWSYETVEYSAGEEAGIKSVTYLVHARYAYGYLKHEKGVHRLVRQSPFNADKLRQTSFAGVEITPILPEESDVVIRDEDLEFDASRSTGAGGQNVNKVNTAVRIKHVPTGIVVECQTQRFQEQNRKIAMQILKSKLWELQEAKRKEEISQIQGEKQLASWGRQIRSYVLHPYKLVKDLRTDFESTDPDSVLDGELNSFIEVELKHFAPSPQI